MHLVFGLLFLLYTSPTPPVPVPRIVREEPVFARVPLLEPVGRSPRLDGPFDRLRDRGRRPLSLSKRRAYRNASTFLRRKSRGRAKPIHYPNGHTMLHPGANLDPIIDHYRRLAHRSLRSAEQRTEASWLHEREGNATSGSRRRRGRHDRRGDAFTSGMLYGVKTLNSAARLGNNEKSVAKPVGGTRLPGRPFDMLRGRRYGSSASKPRFIDDIASSSTMPTKS